jgi:hypothetical protein
MRENRTCGSEGGETGQPVFPTPIFGTECAYYFGIEQLIPARTLAIYTSGNRYGAR